MSSVGDVECTRREVSGRIEVIGVLGAAGSDPSDAARLAARVALLHALGLPPDPSRLAEVDLCGGRGEPPHLVVGGGAGVALGGRAARVSLTHEGPVAAAFVVVSPA